MQLIYTCPEYTCPEYTTQPSCLDPYVDVPVFDVDTAKVLSDCLFMHAMNDHEGVFAGVPLAQWIQTGRITLVCDCSWLIENSFDGAFAEFHEHLTAVWHNRCPYCHRDGYMPFRHKPDKTHCYCGRAF